MALRSPYEFGYTLQSREHRLTTGSLADPVVDLVDDVLIVAVTRGASDVHWEPLAGGLSVRFRIDGQLSEYQFIAGDSAEKVIARLKILGGLDIAERRVPQDGKLLVHFVQQQATRPIDMRFASFPCLYGEKVVTRILDRAFNLLNADTLGLPVGIGLQVSRILSVTHGFLLVCGPTGAGKTTTLYALLGQIDKQVKNIVTMEDPVEYELVGINQSQVNTKIGFSFETGLRSLLRQDPDVIMIGEIRDRPTAQIALEAALTGHLVLTTIHTACALEALVRLMEMGIEPYLISAALTGILAQRLVRRLCSSCKVPRRATEEELMLLRSHGQGDGGNLFQPRGCDDCFGQGFRGRVGIFEYLPLCDELRLLLHKSPDLAAMRSLLVTQEMPTMMHDGLRKVAAGLVAIDEVLGISKLA